MTREVYRNAATLSDGSILIGCESSYDGGFIVSRSDWACSNLGDGGVHYWMDYVKGEGWVALGNLTEEEDAAAALLSADYWDGPHCAWPRAEAAR